MAALTEEEFNATRDAQLAAVDEELEAHWIQTEKEIKAEEERLRVELLALLLLLPTGSGAGGLSIVAQDDEVETIRARALAAIDRAENRLDRLLLGATAGAGNLDIPEDARRVLADGFKETRAFLDQAVRDWRDLYKDTDWEDAFLTDEQVRDLEESVTWGRAQNILAASRQGTRHLREWIVQTFRPGQPRTQAAAFLAGNIFNRNAFRLSDLSHFRQVFRQTVRDLALSVGLDRFRLDIPPGFRPSPGGLLSQNSGRILSLAAWIAFSQRINQDRGVAASAGPFDLGIHYGDRSYMTALPPGFEE